MLTSVAQRLFNTGAHCVSHIASGEFQLLQSYNVLEVRWFPYSMDTCTHVKTTSGMVFVGAVHVMP